MSGLAFIYITVPNKKEAKKIARHLLKSRLIACANIFPIDSLYWWQEKITNNTEAVLIVKTFNKNFHKVVKEVEKIHPYSTPCIAKIEVNTNKKFSCWLKREIDGSKTN